jgi:hypothetical protein
MIHIRGLIKNIQDKIYCRKTKASTSYLKYLLQSTTLQIVCSNSSDPYTFQCMSGRLVWEWPATAMSYVVVYLHDVLKSFPLQGALQPGEEEEVTRDQIW